MNETIRIMIYLTRTILIAVCLAVLTVVFVVGQERPQELQPNQPITFSISPNGTKSFSLSMKEDGFAEITWLANESLLLSFGFVDESGHVVEVGDSTNNESAVFIAPKAGRYTFVIKYDPSSEISGSQNVSLEYKNLFKLARRTIQKDLRRINGYDVKILYEPGTDADFGKSLVTIEKGGKLKKLFIDGGNPTYIGFSFSDHLADAKSAAAKRNANLIQSTLDKTGDSIPDVMIDYFSGGAHCCFSTYFVNLGETVELVEVIRTEHAGIFAVANNPKGGLRFETSENSFAYWKIFFAGSPFPSVILEFANGELRPNFDLMKKPPPSLTLLKSKARATGLKLNNDAYTSEGDDFEEAFWGEMLDLIYTGNEALAWQYFDLVWPAKKPGKDRFLADFKEQLGESYYGTRKINSSNSFRNFMLLFEKNLRKVQ